MNLGDMKHVEISDPQPTDEPTGTRVVIDGFRELGAHLRLRDEEIRPRALQAQSTIQTADDSADES